MKICMYVSVVYSISDFIINGLAIIKQCIGPEMQSEETIQQCNGFSWSSSIEQCYEKLTGVESTFFSGNRCPKLGDPTTTMVYTSNVIQLLVLTIGVVLAFVRQKPMDEYNVPSN